MTYNDDVLNALENEETQEHYKPGETTTAVIQRAVVKPHKSWDGVTVLELVMSTAEGKGWTEEIEISPLTDRSGKLNQTSLNIFAATMRKCGYADKLSEVINGAHENIIGNTVQLEFKETKKGWTYAKVAKLISEGETEGIDAVVNQFDGAEVASGAGSDSADIF